MLNRTILETVRSCGQTFGRLRRDRRGVAAVIVAVTLPLTITAIGAAVDVAWLQVRSSELQDVADSAATAARNKLDPFQPYYQQPATDEAERIASLNDPSTAVAQADVVQGWWDITKANDDPTKFGPPIAGQTGSPFSNAVRVTARKDHKTIFGSFLGLTDVALSKTGTGYKCSNLDYPLTLIQNDVPTPALPAIYMSWATPGHADNTSYYYQQPNGDRNPIFKFYSPYDGQDVSFVLTMSNGYELQVDTYCAGTYLVSPAAFRVQDFVDSSGHPVTITGVVQRGSTNNSFAVYPNQSLYPFAITPTPYYTANSVLTPQYDNAKVKTTPYPSSYGTQYWASEGDPTPDRRTLLVN